MHHAVIGFKVISAAFTNAVSLSAVKEPILGDLKGHNESPWHWRTETSLLALLTGPCGEEAGVEASN